MADRLLEPDGGDRRHPDRRLLGIPPAELSLPDLFKLDGAYSYDGGVNWRAIGPLVAAILPVVPGFLRAATTPGGQVANPTPLDTLYTYAWFVTFGLSFVLYLLAGRPERRS